MTVTIKDIAKRLNTTHSTVSYVLSGKEGSRISEATRQRVLEVAREMGYRPNRMARALVTGKTNLVAFWSSDLAGAFLVGITRHLQSLARADGFEIITSEYGPQTKIPTDGGGLTEWNVDGILTCGAGDWLSSIQAAGRMPKVPIVDMKGNSSRSMDYVNTDLYQPAREAVRHLVSLGRKRVSHICWDSVPGTESRFMAYLDEMKEYNMDPEVIRVRTESKHAARTAIREYSEIHGCPGAVFCTNDDMAMGVYRGIRDMGLKIPEDVAIVGCDGIEDLLYMDPPISTIVQPVDEICRLAWEFLKRRMNNPGIPRQTAEVKAYLEIRESSKFQAG